jgi:hypothetical protein
VVSYERMPKDPKGQKRPADVIANAVHVMKIATGEITIKDDASSPSARGRLGGRVGGVARSQVLSDAERRAIAKKGAAARWSKKRS